MERYDEKSRRPSVRGLARMADVSPSTVSRALSGKEGVSEATRAHILRLAQQTGLIGNGASERIGAQLGERVGERAGAAGNPDHDVAITVLVDARGNPCLADLTESAFFMELIGGLSAAGRDYGATLHVARVDADADLDAAFAKMGPGNGRPGGSDGVIWLGYQRSASYRPWFDDLAMRETPVVLCDHHVAELGCDAVLSDNIGGSMAIASYVAGLGHQRVAILQQELPSVASALRTRGFRAGLLERGKSEAKRS